MSKVGVSLQVISRSTDCKSETTGSIEPSSPVAARLRLISRLINSAAGSFKRSVWKETGMYYEQKKHYYKGGVESYLETL